METLCVAEAAVAVAAAATDAAVVLVVAAAAFEALVVDHTAAVVASCQVLEVILSQQRLVRSAVVLDHFRVQARELPRSAVVLERVLLAEVCRLSHHLGVSDPEYVDPRVSENENQLGSESCWCPGSRLN